LQAAAAPGGGGAGARVWLAVVAVVAAQSGAGAQPERVRQVWVDCWQAAAIGPSCDGVSRPCPGSWDPGEDANATATVLQCEAAKTKRPRPIFWGRQTHRVSGTRLRCGRSLHVKGAVQSGRLGFRLDGVCVAGIERRTSDIVGNASSRWRFANRRALVFCATLMGMDAENENICKSN